MEQELYKHRSVSSCIRKAWDTVAGNAKTIITNTWWAALANAAVVALPPVLDAKTSVGMAISVVAMVAAIVTNALLMAKIATLLNGKGTKRNFWRFLKMSAVMTGCAIVTMTVMAGAYILISQSTPVMPTPTTLYTAIGVAIGIAAIMGIALLPTAYSCMNYLYTDGSKLGSIFGKEYGAGLRSWGYLFMLHMLIAIIAILIYIPLFAVPNTIMMADLDNASSMALGDADGLPAGFKLMFYAAAVVATWLMSYVATWGHIAVYYAYGSISSRNSSLSQKEQAEGDADKTNIMTTQH